MGLFRFMKEEYGINNLSDLTKEGAVPMIIQKYCNELQHIGIPELKMNIAISDTDAVACKNLLHRYLLEAPKGRGWRQYNGQKAWKMRQDGKLRYYFVAEISDATWVYTVDADSYYELAAILMMLKSPNVPKEWDDNAIAFVKEIKSRFVQK